MLANIGFVATYIVGSPIRVSEIFLFGFLGFISRSRPLIVQILAFTAGLTYSMVNFISSLFNLPVYEIVNSVRFLNDWRFFSSGEYLAFALAFAGILMVACRAFRRPTNFSGRGAASLAFAAIALVAIADVWAGYRTLGNLKRFPIGNAPFSSAVSKSNILPTLGSGLIDHNQ